MTEPDAQRKKQEKRGKDGILLAFAYVLARHVSHHNFFIAPTQTLSIFSLNDERMDL
jgi:hypothetical protein